MKLNLLAIAASSMLVVSACGNNATNNTNEGAASRKLLDPANMDTTVHPGDNFFQYANGTWLKNNPVPETESRWGSFNELQENNYKALQTLLDSVAAITNAPAGSTAQKVGDLYRTGMDSNTINKIGLAPLNDILARINNIKEVNGLIEEIALEHTQGIGQVFGFYISPDDKNVSKQMCQFMQGGRPGYAWQGILF